MALETTPWMIGGGAEHSAAIARTVAFAATGGRSGVASPTDLRVAAQNTPNGTVRVLSGVATLNNTYAGGAGQAYVARNLSQTNVAIQPTGSSGGRSDLIVLSVLDPEFEGSAPTDPNEFNYSRLEVISGVPSTTRNLDNIELPRPAIALARIDIPANTGTITSGMIKDLRVLANPRRERHLRVHYPSGYWHDGTAHKVGSSYSSWPIKAADRPTLYVPEWATQMQIVVNISGAYYVKGTSVDSVIGMRTGFGAEGSQNGIAIAADTGRYHYSVIGEHLIEPSRRGTNQLVNVQAQQTRGNGTFWADYQTSVSIDIEFSEVID